MHAKASELVSCGTASGGNGEIPYHTVSRCEKRALRIEGV